MENISILLGAALLLLLAALIGAVLHTSRENRRLLLRLRQNAERQNRDAARLGQAFHYTAGRMSDLSERQDRLRDSVDQRLTQSFQGVNRQLAEVHRGLGEVHRMAGEFGEMRRVLTGVKTRGIWGEAQLGALLNEVLAPGQYLANAAIPAGSATRVEFAVRIPAGEEELLLPIDSKFPQEDFLRLAEAAEAGDPVALERAGQALERALTEQAKQIHDKYIRPPETTDFALMFLPVESLYAEAVRRDGLTEKLLDQYRVLPAGPATLTAMLSSLALGFRSMTLQKKSGEVLRALTEVREEFARYEEALQLARKRLSLTEEALNQLETRSRALGRSLKRLDSEDETEA